MGVLRALIHAIADERDKKPEELEIVLQDHISVDAIQHLHEHESDRWSLQFELQNHTVQILGDGSVYVDDTQKRGSVWT